MAKVKLETCACFPVRPKEDRAKWIGGLVIRTHFEDINSFSI